MTFLESYDNLNKRGKVKPGPDGLHQNVSNETFRPLEEVHLVLGGHEEGWKGEKWMIFSIETLKKPAVIFWMRYCSEKLDRRKEAVGKRERWYFQGAGESYGFEELIPKRITHFGTRQATTGYCHSANFSSPPFCGKWKTYEAHNWERWERQRYPLRSPSERHYKLVDKLQTLFLAVASSPKMNLEEKITCWAISKRGSLPRV